MYYSTGRYYFVLPAQYTRSTTTTLLPPCLYLDKYKKGLLVGQANSHQLEYVHIVLVRSGPPLWQVLSNGMFVSVGLAIETVWLGKLHLGNS